MIRVGFRLIPATVLMLGGCSTLGSGIGGPDRGQVGDVPDAVAVLAAPGQDLQSVRLLPEDGCYWYQYAGPVETTLLPLRTLEGEKICLQPTL